MKALVMNPLGHGFDFEDVGIAAPIGREVLVDVQASGLCHTDLLVATHDIVPLPAVLGHEFAGIVADVGPDVTQFRVGDHVVGSLTQSCTTTVQNALSVKDFLARVQLVVEKTNDSCSKLVTINLEQVRAIRLTPIAPLT